MIKINYALLKEDAAEIYDLAEEVADLIEELKNAFEYFEEAKSKRVFPELTEQLKIMIDELEDFGFEGIKQISTAIEAFAEEFNDLDKKMEKRNWDEI